MAAAALIALRIGNTRQAAPLVMVNADRAAELASPARRGSRPPLGILISEMTDSTSPARRPPSTGGRGSASGWSRAAVQLLHQQGIERTTLADIAKVADVPPGNVYYYFKTKDEVIAAVIEAHAQQVRTTLASIDARHRSPKAG